MKYLRIFREHRVLTLSQHRVAPLDLEGILKLFLPRIFIQTFTTINTTKRESIGKPIQFVEPSITRSFTFHNLNFVILWGCMCNCVGECNEHSVHDFPFTSFFLKIPYTSSAYWISDKFNCRTTETNFVAFVFYIITTRNGRKYRRSFGEGGVVRNPHRPIFSASQLSVEVSNLHAGSNGRLEITCLATIPAHVGPGEQFADYKTYSVKSKYTAKFYYYN